MERTPQGREKKKDRTGAWISFALHVLIIGLLLYLVSKTEVGKRITESIMGTTREIKDKTPPPPPAKAIDKSTLKPPPDAPAAPTRRAADAPPPVAESFFTKGETKEGGPSRVVTTAPVVQAPIIKPPPKVFSSQGSSIKQLMEERAKASSVVESFGSEQISKSGVSDVGDIVGKISGATVSEGKFAVVRGLADRYTLSTLNGVDIPSADPDRRAAQLDLFPAQFLNRVDVNKTFQPDLPGGFAGGAVNIVTRSFPERPIFSFSMGSSYNTQASLKDDFLFTDQGSKDWLAMDDGTRTLPPQARAQNPRGDVKPPPELKGMFESHQFGVHQGESLVNSSMALAFGDTTYLFGRPLGFLAGINYKNEYSHYNDGNIKKYLVNVRNGTVSTLDDYVDVRSVIEYTWGSLATMAYKISDNHQIDANFMYVQTAEDEGRHLQGQNSDQSTEEGFSYVDKQILHWTERNLNNFQLKGTHLFPDLIDTKLEWVGSLANTSQEEPDHRIFQFLANTNPPPAAYTPQGSSQPSKPTRIWRDLQEDNKSFRADLTIPLSPYQGKDNSLKVGYYISHSEQTYDSRAWEMNLNGNHPFFTNGIPDSVLDSRFFPLIDYLNFPANFQYTGEQTIEAGYAMGTWAPFEWVRFVGGVRYETTQIAVDTVNITKAGDDSSAAIDQKDLLPALSGTFFLRQNLQLRAAWSETIIRPTYREISNAELYDVARGRTIKGNPDLVLSASQNYDARLEWYPRPGELISIGGFYKKIDRPIELAQVNISGDTLIYNNYEYADVWGIELELRKNFPGFWGMPYDQFSLGFNYAYIHSEVPRTGVQRTNQMDNVGESSAFRPLYDQPEYVLNADLTWDSFLSGTSITIQGGVVGRRLVVIGYGFPDEYEEPAPQLEFSISQRIGRHWKARFSAKNLLDPIYEKTQTYPSGTLPVQRSTKGMQFGLSIGCEF